MSTFKPSFQYRVVSVALPASEQPDQGPQASTVTWAMTSTVMLLRQLHSPPNYQCDLCNTSQLEATTDLTPPQRMVLPPGEYKGLNTTAIFQR